MANLPPAEVIASWPTPNYIDPVTRGPDLLIVSIVFTSLAFVLTSLRIYTRLWITGSFGVDDLLGVVALVRALPFPPREPGRWTMADDCPVAGINCHVHRHLSRHVPVWLGPPCVGCPARMDSRYPEDAHGLPDHILRGLDIYQAVPVVVL
jgi:hypothetical protein